MAEKKRRPLSPHLEVHRFEYTMASSILHRITGAALSVAAILIVLWLGALSIGGGVFGFFQMLMGSWFGQFVLLGLIACVFYHLANGIRHMIWDLGYGFDLKVSHLSAYFVFGFTFVMFLITLYVLYF